MTKSAGKMEHHKHSSHYVPTLREEIYNSTHISGEHLISQSYCKWRQKYLDEKALQLLSQEQCYSEEDVPPTVAEEVVISQNRLNGGVTPEADDNLAPASGGTPAVRTPNFSGRKCGNNFDTTNGAVRDLYAWTQTVEDVEVRVTVPDNIMRGKQVRVVLQTSSVEVGVQEPDMEWHTLLKGRFSHNIKSEESVWSLVPGEHVSIHLEKSDECWWNRLLFCEDPIDMKKINAERDYATLPQEERQKIEELVWNQQQKDKGKPTTDQLKMESLLRVAWNAEGSPFQGKPYDPSLINFTDGGTFGNG
ncbi:nudC domain-containing protein 3 isoform X2 [Procambarus clarkii]|uniref:nudC domain-containing protein 3 isoform X2 n=1 Tax=Procambarus clarkii TaxID=6728 RepID=UPI0037438521